MKIKVCGITREEDIAELLLAGVDFIGFNFIKSSPRYIDINWAVNIINKYNIQKKAVPLCEISDLKTCLLYTSPSPRDQRGSRMAACA